MRPLALVASAISGLDLLFLVLVLFAVGGFTAVVLYGAGGRGARWWRSRFGVGAPAAWFTALLAAVGLWAPVAIGEAPPGYDFVFALGGVVYVLGLLPVGRALGNLHPYLLLAATPTKHAVDAEAGRLAVQGIAETDDPVTAPVSGVEAVRYRLKVERTPADADERERRRRRETVHLAERGGPFRVRDSTGYVRVIPDAAEFRLAADAECTVDPADDPADSIVEYADSTPDLTLGAGRHTFAEAALESGAAVFVFGVAERRDGVSVLASGREFFLKEGTREDAVTDFRAVVVHGGIFGAVVAAAGLATMALSTGAI